MKTTKKQALQMFLESYVGRRGDVPMKREAWKAEVRRPGEEELHDGSVTFLCKVTIE